MKYLNKNMIVQFFNFEYQWMAYVGSIIAFIIAFYATFKLFHKYQTKKSQIVLIVASMVGFLGLAAFIDFLAFTLVHGEIVAAEIAEAYELISLGSALSFSFNAISNILLLEFDHRVFHSKEGRKWKYLVYVAELTVPLGIIPMVYTGGDNTAFMLIHIVCSLYVYITLSKDARDLSQKLKTESAEESVEQKALKMIAWSGIFFILAISGFVIHEIIVMSDLPIREYYTVTAGWIFGAVAGFLIYLGFIVPVWMRERWEKKNQ